MTSEGRTSRFLSRTPLHPLSLFFWRERADSVLFFVCEVSEFAEESEREGAEFSSAHRGRNCWPRGRSDDSMPIDHRTCSPFRVIFDLISA